MVIYGTNPSNPVPIYSNYTISYSKDGSKTRAKKALTSIELSLSDPPIYINFTNAPTLIS